MAKDLLENKNVIYDINPSGEDAAIAKDMKARGITPTTASQYINENYPDRATNEPKDLLSDPVQIAKRSEEFGGMSNPPPGFWSKEGPVVGGAIGGSILGGKIGSMFGPIGTTIGGIGGAGIGGFGGALTSQKLTGMPTDIKDAALEGGLQAAAQAGGETGLFLLKKGWPSIGGDYLLTDIKALGEKFAPYVDKFLPPKQKVVQGFFPYQLSAPESAAAKWQNIVESSFGGRAPTARFHWAQKGGAKEFADETAKVVWNGVQRIPPEQVGKETLSAYELARDASKAIGDKLYSDVDSIATQQGVYVDYKAVTDYFNSVLKGRKSGRSEMGDTAMKNFLDDMAGGVDTFSGAHDMRIRFGKVINSFGDGDPGKGIIIKAKKMLDNAMDVAGTNNGNTQVKDMYGRAKSFWGDHLDTYHNDFLESFAEQAKESPSLAADLFLKADRPEPINALWKATGGKNTVTAQNIQASAVEKWLTKAATEEGSDVVGGQGGVESGKKLWNILKTMDGQNGMLRQIFPDATVDRLWETAKILSTVQKKPTSGGGGMLIQLLQANALTTVGGGLVGYGGYRSYQQGKAENYFDPQAILSMVGGAAALFTPRVVAKILTHPVYGKWFIEGANPSKGATYQGYQFMNKLITVAGKYYMEDQSAEQQQQDLAKLPGATIQQGKDLFKLKDLGQRPTLGTP